jgi:NADPH:quinone reductase-like Zn-dependent oxidoreductase
VKAAVYRRYGPPDVVTVEEMPVPRPCDDEILVRVHAATVGVVDGLGASSVVDYTRADFTRAGRRYDVVFDVAGTSSFGRCRAVLNRGGVYLTTAPSPAIFMLMGWTARFGAFGARRAVVAFTGLRAAEDKRRDLEFIAGLAGLAGTPALVAVIAARYPLTQIADAYRRLDAGHKKGNVVVTMA